MFGGATSTPQFYAKVDENLTSVNQKTVKKTIQDLIDKQELPVTAQNLILLLLGLFPRLFVRFISLPILPTSKTPSSSLNFSDFDVYVVMHSDFSNKSEEMCQFFKKRGYAYPVVNTAQHRAQQIDRQPALQTSQKEKNDRIPFTLTCHPHNLAAKNFILKNFKSLRNDNETGGIFSQPPLISFKRDKKHRELSS